MADEERFKADLALVKEWYYKQPHLPKGIDERIISSFVSGTKSLEKAKKKLDNYFTLKHDVLDMSDARDPTHPALVESHPGVKMFFLPGLTDEGYKVMFETFEDCDVSKYNHECQLVIKHFLMDFAFHEWHQQNNYIMVMDVKSLPLHKVNIQCAIKAVNYVMKAHPKKMKKFILVNCHPAVEKVTKFLLNFASKKSQNRVILIDSDKNVNEELKKHLPSKMLPSNYGGDASTTEELYQYWLKELASRKDWFRDRLVEVADESKRPSNAFEKASSIDYSTEGSFRMLTID